MSNASRSMSAPGSSIPRAWSTFSITGVLRKATVPSESTMAARAGSLVGAPCWISSTAAASWPDSAREASAAADARSSSWNPIVPIANFKVWAR